ncbi:class II fumarate hydratase [bacterium]|nr:class II fumarate hydratase [bacterium]
MKYRTEHDALGEVRIPADALWGAQTQRAVENFPVSGEPMPRAVLYALARIKLCAAEINVELAVIDRARGEAIKSAALEVLEGTHDAQFPVDIYQTGSGTSTNMNMNEVLSHLATAQLQKQGNNDTRVHPNDHVNAGQSSNDVMPTAMHVAILQEAENALLPNMQKLHNTLREKAAAFDGIMKVGRTHLQDATPLTLGEEFSGYARQVEQGMRRIRQSTESLRELPMGGTAVGTGLNAHPDFARSVIEALSEQLGISFREAENHFEAQGARDAAVEYSSALKTVSVSLMKIANDLRWMSSGPDAGLAEITLPALQPGSSIMPGKLNPVIPEAVAMVCARVMGNDVTVTVAGQSGNFELNVMIPVLAATLLESTTLLANATDIFAMKCIVGIEPNRDRLRSMSRANHMTVTALVPQIGHEAAVAIAQKASSSGRSIRDVAGERTELSAEQLDELLGTRDEDN